MPEQQIGPISRYVPPESFGNAIYKGMANIRAGQESQTKQELADAQIKKLETENSPENQNYLRQEKQAELSKKQNDAKKSGLDIYTQRLAAVRDVDDFSKGLPYLAKDLEPFGEEGSKELMPRVTFKTDLSGQKQIPDNDAFLKERDRIVDALGKITGKTKVKPGDTIKWTEDVKDEATGKMKTVDKTKVYMEDGSWKDATATHGGIKDGDAKAPEVKNFQVGEREVPHQWDDAKKEWTPMKGKGGPKWNPKEDKPDMTEPQAREKLFQLTKWEAQLEKTGGVDEFLFAMIAKDSPDLAKQMQGADKTEAKNFLKEQKEYYKGFTKPGKKAGAETIKPKAAASGSKQPPAGYKDTGKTSGGKKVYSNGTSAWME